MTGPAIQQPPLTQRQVYERMADIVRTVDEHARESNRRWGFNRLPHIVPIEWTERFKSQQRKWVGACWECGCDPTEAMLAPVRQHGEAMIRAFDKLEEIALANGKSPAPPGVWEFELADGTPITLVRARAEMAQLERTPPALVWSLDEVAQAIDATRAQFPGVFEAKNAFPDCEILQLRTPVKVRQLIDDELCQIPF